jgi:preprotein translocase subunit Sec63
MFIRKHTKIYHIGLNTIKFLKNPSFSFTTKFNAKKDYYTILGIPKDASNDQIKKAF